MAVERHEHTGTDSARVSFNNLKDIPEIIDALGEANPPLDSVTAPSGGATQDAEARTAINTIITRLEALGLVNEN